MIKTMCEDFSFILVRNRIISEDDREVYIYGLELLVNSLLVVGTILTLGLLLNKILVTVTFLIVFCSIRSYAGGFHASQYWKCYCIGCLSYLSIITVVHSTAIFDMYICSFIFSSISYIGIYSKAPLNSKKNPKTEKEMQRNSVITKVLISIYTLITAIGIFAYPQGIELWFTIACTQLVVTIFLMITILQRRYLR
ncbi:accessory gene regulator B family protein [Cellulosilyticum sp. I15G10I2]|uniref:accessory gene regulator B family protein n=1 Tax=Cellulosilyticum sp. I15G10I2 TaxID=1892843 RepID=UPI00085CD193|nr:accessory gene regulator B family protein [Cellulosilyticum sp. I15G10I2]